MSELQPTTEDLIDFIKVAHAGQIDKGAGKPYWEHPVAVMNELPDFASPELKAAALLHDVKEDTAFVTVQEEGEAVRLAFNEEQFAKLKETMRNAKRPTEIQLARERKELNPENTPPILQSPVISQHTLKIVDGVTNEEFVAPPFTPPEGVTDPEEIKKLAKKTEAKLKLAHYQDHIIELANTRPDDAEELRLAEDRVLLKFADMSQNLNKDRVLALTDLDQATKFANKYEKPIQALIERAKEIAEKNGYELNAELVVEDLGEGKKRAYLAETPHWEKKQKFAAVEEAKPERRWAQGAGGG
ncbi:MAG: hypothetical protein SFT92_09350 [Rickettsiales bacterium]|nr:hypothetical protein [Rickettsiales bacterium]